jgi:hypothetical protein
MVDLCVSQKTLSPTCVGGGGMVFELRVADADGFSHAAESEVVSGPVSLRCWFGSYVGHPRRQDHSDVTDSHVVCLTPTVYVCILFARIDSPDP